MKRNFTRKRLLFLLLFALYFTGANAQSTLLIENFDYTAGSLLTSNGWGAHSGGTTNAIAVSNSGLSLPNYGLSAGNAALVVNTGQDCNLPFTAVISGSVYTSFLFKIDSIPTAGYFFLLGDNPMGTAFRGRVYADTVDGSSTLFKIGLSFGTNTADYSTNYINKGQTYLAVLKYTVVAGTNNDETSLFVFDGTASVAAEPSVATVGPLSNSAQPDIVPGSVGLRQFNTNQRVTIDGICVRTVWNVTDFTAPTATGALGTALYNVKVGFSEPVSQSALTTSYYAGIGGVSSVSLNATMDTATLALITPLTPNAAYALVVDSVNDLAGNPMSATTLNFIAPDFVKPTVLNATATSPSTIQVVFDEPVGSASATDTLNYTGITHFASITLNTIGDTATITLSSPITLNTPYYLTIDNVADVAGNTMASAQQFLVYSGVLPLELAFTTNGISCFGANDGIATALPQYGTSPYTYLWANGATTQTVTGLATGWYKVTVTDAASNTKIDSAFIFEPTAVTVAYTATDPTCFGTATGSITAQGNGGASHYHYVWNTGDTLPTITGLLANTYMVTATDTNSCTGTATIVLTDPAQLVVTIDATLPVSCNGGNDGAALASATGGNGNSANFSYVWSNGAMGNTGTLLSAMSYIVTVTDSLGCTDTATAYITEPTPVVFAFDSVRNVSCAGANDGFVAVSMSGGAGSYSFVWSNGTSNDTLTGISGGVYTVSATDQNGCGMPYQVTITEPTPLTTTSSVTANVSCFNGNDGAGEVVASGSTAPYTYAWSNGATTANITDTAGVYYVTVSDANSCTAIDSVVFTQPTALVVALDSVMNSACELGATGIAYASAQGGTGTLQFAWDDANAQSTATATGLMPGIYTLVVTDDNACTASVQATIGFVNNAPTVSVGNDVQLCAGSSQSVSATTGLVSYLWNTGATSSDITVSMAGSYTVIATDTNGCEGFDTLEVVVNALPVVNLGNDTSFCAGNAVVADAGAGFSIYAWSTNSTAQTVVITTSGTYRVTVTDANGCSGTDTKIVTVNALPVVNLGNDTSICVGTSLTLNASGGAGQTYSWSTGATSASIVVNQINTYSVTVTSSAGCTNSDQILMLGFNPNPIVNLGPDTTICAGSSIFLTPGTYSTYNWSTGSKLPQIQVSTANTYSVTVTNSNGCVGSDSRVVSLQVCGNVGVEEVALQQAVAVYPNPIASTGFFIANNGQEDIVSIQIIAITGEVVASSNAIISAGNNAEITALNNKAAGIYIVSVSTKSQTAVYRLIKN